jgi:hypothetical protein
MWLPTTIAPYYVHSAVGASHTLSGDRGYGGGGGGRGHISSFRNSFVIYLFQNRECLPERCVAITMIITHHFAFT